MTKLPSSSTKKQVQMDPALVRAYVKAKIAAEEQGNTEFPESFSAFLNAAAEFYLREKAPEALKVAPGRPRKTAK